MEVINGPQGTLFGRNATGGSIQVCTKTPVQEFGGSASVGYGNFETAEANDYLTGSIAENIASDIAVPVRDQGEPYGTNALTVNGNEDTDSRFVRSKTLFTPNDNLAITWSLDCGDTRIKPLLQPVPGTQPVGEIPYTPADLSVVQ